MHQNKSLTSDYDGILSFQGVGWLTRKVIVASKIIVAVKQSEDEVTSLTHLELDNRMPMGLPGVTDTYILNWQDKSIKDDVFGNVRDKARWVRADSLEDEFQRNGWECGSTEVLELFTTHDDIAATTSQVCGFEKIDGVRRHTRRMVVKRNGERKTLRAVFDYVGKE